MSTPANTYSHDYQIGGGIEESCVSLVRRIQAGDQTAEEDLATFYSRRVYSIAVCRIRDREAAKDLTQEILMAVLSALRAGRLREGEKLAAFIQGTARNIISNYMRSCARYTECPISEFELYTTDFVEEVESADRRRLIGQELAACSPTDRQILHMSLVNGDSMSEIAEKLHLSHDAVRARRSRLIKKLTKKFVVVSQSGQN
jgi:RNA polymerase sigma-70 factor (ECF subfamily)